MSSAVILQHVAHEAPGRIVPIFRDYGIPVQLRRLYQGDEVPTDLDEVRVLVVLGGPMSVSDVGNSKFPYLEPEIEVLKRMIAADRPVLGICLGAQLLAHAAGARVYPNTKPGQKPDDPPVPAAELGWGPVTFPFPGGTEPIVTGMTDGSMMFHWHYDMFDLPRLPPPPDAPKPPAPPPPTGNALLSSSRLCKNQAFRFKNRLFGFQYHFEFTEDDLEAVLAAGRQDIAKVLGPDGEKTIRQDTAKNYPRYARQGERLVRNFVQFLKVY
ncbi:MAG: gamma-glutamyl-gamma-aminobutyrate hydrolase family protein [Tepidisphaeraceae bacterium]|jgi:GMP synthase-like glutamine amidotransferase